MIIGIVIGVVVLFLLIVAGISVRIVREYQRIVLFRLGRALGTRGPGLIFINPVTDRTAWVDLREQYLEIRTRRRSQRTTRRSRSTSLSSTR